MEDFAPGMKVPEPSTARDNNEQAWIDVIRAHAEKNEADAIFHGEGSGLSLRDAYWRTQAQIAFIELLTTALSWSWLFLRGCSRAIRPN